MLRQGVGSRPAKRRPQGLGGGRWEILGTSAPSAANADKPRNIIRKYWNCRETLGDNRGISATLANLGNLHVDAGEWERGRAYYLEALDRMELFEDDAAKAVLLSDLGLVGQGNPALRAGHELLFGIHRLDEASGKSCR